MSKLMSLHARRFLDSVKGAAAELAQIEAGLLSGANSSSAGWPLKMLEKLADSKSGLEGAVIDFERSHPDFIQARQYKASPSEDGVA